MQYFGAVRQCFATQGVELTELAYPPKAYVSPHHCPGFFMALGAAFVEGWADTTQRLEPGDVSYHPADEAYWLRLDGESARGFAVDISDEWRRVHGVDTPWDDVPRDLSQNRVSWLISRLFIELNIRDTARPLIVEALSLEICAELAGVRARSERRRPPWLSPMLDMLRNNTKESVSLSDLTAVGNVSAVTVIKAFRQHEGMTPGHVMRSLRLVDARRALAGTDLPLSMIAAHVGFYDQSHFSRAFSAATGTTPRAYRMLLRGTRGT